MLFLMKGSYLFQINMIISRCYSKKTRAEKAKAKAFSKAATRAEKAKAKAKAREEEIAQAEEYVDNVVKQLSQEKPNPVLDPFRESSAPVIELDNTVRERDDQEISKKMIESQNQTVFEEWESKTRRYNS